MTENPSLFYQYTLGEIRAWGKERDLPAYRIGQLWSWVYQRGAASFDDMSNLPKDLRAELNARFSLELPTLVVRQRDPNDGTSKILLELNDGERVESVIMPRFSERAQTDPRTGAVRDRDKRTVKDYTACLSTQAGCQYACRFCASGQDGLQRNLSAGEIVSQVMRFRREGEDVSHIVFMGSGEPLHNYEEVRRAVEILTCEEGLNFSSRKITLSTVGVVPEIYRMAKDDWKIKLAISLHAPADEKREQLIPIARSYSLSQLKDALLYYQRLQPRRVTFEYLMIADFNDSPKDAEKLIALADGLICHVNLIPYNAVPRAPFQPTPARKIDEFRNRLRKRNLDATVRYSRGRNIDAACGQLRRRMNQPAVASIEHE